MWRPFWSGPKRADRQRGASIGSNPSLSKTLSHHKRRCQNFDLMTMPFEPMSKQLRTTDHTAERGALEERRRVEFPVLSGLGKQ